MVRRRSRCVTAVVTVAAAVALVVGAPFVALLDRLGPGQVRADDRSFALESLVTEALVAADGSMQVSEQVRYRFDGGPFTVVIRSFERDLDQISDMAASDGAGPLPVVGPADSVSGEWEAFLRAPAADQVVDITFTYRVSDAVDIGRDVGDLNWQFVGTEHPGIDAVRIAVRFAGNVPAATPAVADTDDTVLRGWAHGPSNGTVEVEMSMVIAEVSDVPAGQFVEIRAAVPAAAFNVRGNEVLLPGILDEERRLAGEVEDERRREHLGWVLTPLVMLAGAVATGWLWLRSGREPKSREVLGDYWREPLDDPPALAIATIGRGKVPTGPLIAGTIADLAQRGYLTIRAELQERFGPDRTVHHFTWAGADITGLEAYEREMLELVFRGSPTADSDELADWARANRTTAKRLLDSIDADVDRLYRAKGYDEAGVARFTTLVTICATVAVASLVVRIVSGNGIAWFGVGSAVALFALGLIGLRNRTAAGADAAAKAIGLRNFLRDFSRLSDAPIGHLVLWERYLVYSVAFGVSAELVRGLASRVPQVMSDPSFGVWYVGAGAHFDGFDQLGVQGVAVARAAVPSSSGSGGGFSGGGSSGGGGGGGFGAR